MLEQLIKMKYLKSLPISSNSLPIEFSSLLCTLTRDSKGSL
jgi:hypothetical protein